MKTTIFALAAAGLVAAQDFSGQPECAVKCLSENIPKAGCDLDDTACQCSEATQAKLVGLIAPCLTAACTPTELLAAQRAAAAACEAFAASASGSSSASAGSASASTTGSVSATITETATETATEDDETTLVTGFTLTGLETVTGSVTLPVILSSVSEIESIIPPIVTPGSNSSVTTRTRTVGTNSDGATTVDGGSSGSRGSRGSGTATGTNPPASTETNSGASFTGPVFGLMAIFAAALAL